MRYFSLPVLILSTALAGPVIPAFQANAEDTEIVRPLTKEGRLEDLFLQLRRKRDPVAAGEIAGRIWREWNDSGSATVNLILEWARDAANKKQYAASLDFLDQATSLLPGYAEAWNKRATLHYQMGNYAKSMSDVTRVLALEPRHFGALAGMAVILEETGNDEQALAVWKRMLEVYPADRKAQLRVKVLSEKLAGSRT